MPVPPVSQETPEESNSGFKLQPDNPVATLESMEACQTTTPSDAHPPPIVIDVEMEDEAPTSSANVEETANGTRGDSHNGNKSSSSEKRSGKYSDMTKKELIADLKLSDQIIEAMTKDQQRMNRMESLLHKENERLTKKLSDSLQKADAERTRAEDMYKKYSETTLFNKVAEESSTQRFFKEKHYEETIEKIKTESDKRVRDLQNELRDSSIEIGILTRELEQAKRPLEKEKDFCSIIRTISTALEMFVELDDVKEQLGLLGETVTQRYEDATKDSRNESKEFDVAKKIAKLGDEELSERAP